MGYMKWISGLIDTGYYQQLEYEYIKAIENNSQYIMFEDTYLDVNFVNSILLYIKKMKEQEQYDLLNNEESKSDRL